MPHRNVVRARGAPYLNRPPAVCSGSPVVRATGFALALQLTPASLSAELGALFDLTMFDLTMCGELSVTICGS